MALVHQHVPRRAQHDLVLEIGLARRREHQLDVDAPAPELDEPLLRGEVARLQLDAGLCGDEAPQPGPRHRPERRHEAEPSRASERAHGCTTSCASSTALSASLRLLEERGAGRRRLDPPRSRSSRRTPSCALEPRDRLRKSRLRDLQTLRRPRDLSLFDHDHQILQLTQVDRWVDVPCHGCARGDPRLLGTLPIGNSPRRYASCLWRRFARASSSALPLRARAVSDRPRSDPAPGREPRAEPDHHAGAEQGRRCAAACAAPSRDRRGGCGAPSPSSP